MNPNPPNLPNPLEDPERSRGTNPSRPGYEYLACYQLGLVIQELTDQFCNHFMTPNPPNIPNPDFRQIMQMTQAARSIPQNVAEGFTQVSLKGYIYLSGIALGSNEEVSKDFVFFLKREGLQIYPANHPKIREFREFRVKWISPNTLNTPKLPSDPEEAANMILTFCKMEGYLLNKLIESLKEKHKTEGGLTEKLYRERKRFRGF